MASSSSCASGNHSLLEDQEGGHGMGMLGFPLVCLIVGLLLDEVVKRAHKEQTMPATTLMFVFTGLLAGLGHFCLGADEMQRFEQFYTWYAVHPHVVMTLLLPPLIFEAAYKMNAHGFSTDLPLIVIITSGVYLLSTSFMGVVVFMHVGASSGWHLSQVSATDPVSVVAALEELGAPTRVRTLLEGESLLNDGLAIILYHLCKEWLSSDLGLTRFHFVSYVFFKAFYTTLGLALSWLCAVVSVPIINGISNRGRVVSVVLCFVYAVYALSEQLGGSGVLAVTMYGLCLNRRKETISSTASAEIIHMMEMLFHWANATIFTLSGYVVGREMGDGGMMALSGILLYGYAMSIRCALVFLFWLIWNLLVRSPRLFCSAAHTELWIGDAVCQAWGGLRGSLSLLLSLSLKYVFKCSRNQQRAHENLMLISGAVIFSVIIQGTSFPPLARAMTVGRVDSRLDNYRRRKRRRVLASLHQETVGYLHTLFDDYFYAGADWPMLKAMTDWVLADPSPQSSRSSSSSSVQRHQPALYPTDDSDDDESSVEFMKI